MNNEIIQQMYSNNPKQQIGNYKLYRHDNNMKVYVDNFSKKVIVLNQGTSSLKDVVTDISIAGIQGVGVTKRYKNDEVYLHNISNKFKNYDKTLIGHSLGSSINHKYNLNYIGDYDKVISMNRGAGLHDLINRQKADNEIDIQSGSDLISSLSYFNRNNVNIRNTRYPNPFHMLNVTGAVTELVKNELKSHSLNNMLQDDTRRSVAYGSSIIR